MATGTYRRCDVFDTIRDVETFKIEVTTADGKKTVYSKTCDLSPKALKRFEAFMKRATTPPTQAKEEAESES